MPDVDLFFFFRRVLVTLVTVYATVITLQSLWEWYRWLSGQDKYLGLLRRYLIVHGLRLRFTSFWGDLLICVLLCVAFLLLWRAHGVLNGIQQTLSDVRPLAQPQ
jgi:hypothetical protein